LKIVRRFRIEGDKKLSFMKLQSISVTGKDATQLCVGEKFLIISISPEVILNLSFTICFLNDVVRLPVK